MGASLAADGYSTEQKFQWQHTFKNPRYDWNPVIRYAPQSKITTSAMMAAGVATYGLLDYKLRDHPRMRLWGTVAFVVGEALAVRTNYQAVNRARTAWQQCISVAGMANCPR